MYRALPETLYARMLILVETGFSGTMHRAPTPPIFINLHIDKDLYRPLELLSSYTLYKYIFRF